MIIVFYIIYYTHMSCSLYHYYTCMLCCSCSSNMNSFIGLVCFYYLLICFMDSHIVLHSILYSICTILLLLLMSFMWRKFEGCSKCACYYHIKGYLSDSLSTFRKYLLPALPSDQLLDKFAYKPTGSATAALITITHHVTRLLESSSYVRCILIDYSKAFDSINHSILFQKLLQLNLPPNVLLWIINFLSSRTHQAVSSFGQTSGWLSISKSIIHVYLCRSYTLCCSCR